MRKLLFIAPHADDETLGCGGTMLKYQSQGDGGFRPNLFEDISGFVEKKLDIMSYYESEMGVFPLPRSHEAIEALTKLRGAQSGAAAAEAFMILKEVR